MSRLFIRRKSGYLSPYPIGMFYVAAITRPRHFGSENNAAPVFRLGSRFLNIPRPVMEVFRPFNRYRTHEGRKISSFAHRNKE